MDLEANLKGVRIQFISSFSNYHRNRTMKMVDDEFPESFWHWCRFMNNMKFGKAAG